MLLRVTIAAVLASLGIGVATVSNPVPQDSISRAPYRLLVAWSPEGIPNAAEKALDAMKGVRATTVRAGIDWMTASRSPGGKILDQPPPGYAVPLEMLAIDPKEYAHFVTSGDAAAIRALHGGQVLLAETEAALRGGGKGIELSVGRTLHAAAVISNHSAQGYEGLIARPIPPSWSAASRFLLIKANRSVGQARLHRLIAGHLAPGQPFRLHSQSLARFLRYADAVEPPLIIKKSFGEFSVRRLPGGHFQIDPAWIAHHLRTESVPLLGSFACNRRLFPQLRGALKEVVAKGLAGTIDPTQFAGCFNPRLIPSAHSTQLSHHSWGIAVDINARDNPFGAKPQQDPRLVRIMRRWGLTWGGAWLVPDGMHFEWFRFPK